MKIYFLASVAASKKLRHSFKKIISLLEEEGEVVNSGESLEAPEKIINNSESDNKTRAKRLLRSLISSDCVVFEGSHSTTGGGYYLSVALHKNIPVLFLTQEKYSGLYLASYNRLLKIEKYSLSEMKHLQKILNSFIKFVKRKGLNKRFNLLISEDIDNYLNEFSKKDGTSKADIIRSLIHKSMEKTKINTLE